METHKHECVEIDDTETSFERPSMQVSYHSSDSGSACCHYDSCSSMSKRRSSQSSHSVQLTLLNYYNTTVQQIEDVIKDFDEIEFYNNIDKGYQVKEYRLIKEILNKDVENRKKTKYQNVGISDYNEYRSSVLMFAVEKEKYQLARIIARLHCGSWKDEILCTNETLLLYCLRLAKKSEGLYEVAEAMAQKMVIEKEASLFRLHSKLQRIDETFDYLQKSTDADCGEVTALHLAAYLGLTNIMRLLLSFGIDPNVRMPHNGFTSLCYAVIGQQTDCVRFLLDVIVNPNVHTTIGNVLDIASVMGTDDIKKLLQTYVSTYNQTSNDNAFDIRELHNAVMSNSPENVRLALRNIIDYSKQQHTMYKNLVDRRDTDCNTPLIMAAKRKPRPNIEIIQRLKDFGANVQCANIYGKTFYDYLSLDDLMQMPSDFAAEILFLQAKRDDVDSLAYLVSVLDYDVTQTDKNDENLFHYFAQFGGSNLSQFWIISYQRGNEHERKLLSRLRASKGMVAKRKDGKTPLLLACANGKINLVKFISIHCQQWSNIHVQKDENGNTFLHELAATNQSTSEEILRWLNERFPSEVQQIIDTQNSKGNTALHVAAMTENRAILMQLKSLNPNLHIYNKECQLPFYYVFRAFDEAFISFFMNQFDPNYTILEHMSVANLPLLHYAADAGKEMQLRFLIGKGVSVLIRDVDGNSIMHHIALLSKHVAKTKMYLKMIDVVVDEVSQYAKNDILNGRPDVQRLYGLTSKDCVNKHFVLFYLTRCVPNKENQSVLNYAATIGATDFLLRLLRPIPIEILQAMNIPNLNCFNHLHIVYDITFLTPRYCQAVEIANVPNKSLLETIIKSKTSNNLAKIFDQMPMKHLQKEYKSIYERIFFILLVMHITFMFCFTYWSMPSLYRNVRNYSSTATFSPSIYCLFLTWPIILTVKDILFGLNVAIKIYKSTKIMSQSLRILNFVLALAVAVIYDLIAVTIYVDSKYCAIKQNTFLKASSLIFGIIETLFVPILWCYTRNGRVVVIGLLAAFFYVITFASHAVSEEEIAHHAENFGNVQMNCSRSFFVFFLLIPGFSLTILVLISAWVMDRSIKLVSGLIQCVTMVINQILSNLATFIFAGLMIAWFFHFLYDNPMQYHLLAFSLIVGWIYSLKFLSAFQSMHMFIIILKRIIYQDIPRFAMVYIFILVGFSVGLNVLFVNYNPLLVEQPTPFDTMYLAVKMSVGYEDIIDSKNFNKTILNESGWTLIKETNMIFIVVLNVVLLNVIIGMMSHTYNDTLKMELLNWRYDCFKRTLEIPNCLISPALKLVGRSKANSYRYKSLRINEILEMKMFISDEELERSPSTKERREIQELQLLAQNLADMKTDLEKCCNSLLIQIASHSENIEKMTTFIKRSDKKYEESIVETQENQE